MRLTKRKNIIGFGAWLCWAGFASADWQASTNTSGLALKSYPALVVKCGQDYLRQKDGSPLLGSAFGVNAVGLVCGTNGLWGFQNQLLTNLNADVDGDGKTNDDVVSYLPFSTTNRMNPELPWFDSRGASARWFGGIAIAQGDRRVPPIMQENGVNDETVIPVMAPRDNWTLFHETYDVNGPYYFHAVWLWNKADFLADGNSGRVFFDDASTLSVYLQRYWMGFDGARWVVQDGSQFYVSEQTFIGAGQTPYGYANGKQHILNPTQTRWAVYQPQAPYNIVWPVNTNSFSSHTFTNVQAVGWYLFKDRFIPAYTGFKWYAFEAKAVVERPARPSLSLNMVQKQDASRGVPAFYIARCETPYVLWKDVFRRARSNTFVLERGSTFDRQGDMGSMDMDDEVHRLDEPVTDVTVPDVMAWCNALSREEGFSPCYYTDVACTVPFREVITPPIVGKTTNITVYVKWSADGYRLPTSDEWTIAAGGSPVTNGLPVHSSTVAVDADSADTNGLYHIHDNVREMVWVWGDTYNSATTSVPVVLGGDFRRGTVADYGVSGFRLVRRETNFPAPPIREDVSSFQLAQIVSVSTPTLSSPPALTLVDVPGTSIQMADRETSFARWRDVRNWAVTNGYTFDNDGDMGSMDWWGFSNIPPAVSHTSSEPVTDISAYDAMVWCNALSEREGLTPAYYTSSANTQVCCTAFRFRPVMRLDFEMTGLTNQYYQPVYRLSTASGYRLMDRTEYTAAAASGKTQFTGFTFVSQISNRVWALETAGGTTHPVGTSEKDSVGFYDLLGNVMEWGTGENTSTGMQDCFGSAFLDPARLITYTTTIKAAPRGWVYPDLGFRVVRPKP